MVKSPKTGRELEPQRAYKGPDWFRRLATKVVGPNRDDEDDG